MEKKENKENKSSIAIIAILAVVTLLLSLFIWRLEKQVIEVSDENRKLQQEISERAVTTVVPNGSVEETPSEETAEPTE